MLRWVRLRLWATRENRRRVSGYLSMYADDAPGWVAGRQALERMGGEHLFDTMALESAGWVNRAKFQNTYRDRSENYIETNIWPLWTVFALEVWYRMILLNEDPSAVTSTRSPTVPISLAAG